MYLHIYVYHIYYRVRWRITKKAVGSNYELITWSKNAVLQKIAELKHKKALKAELDNGSLNEQQKHREMELN